MENSEEKIFIHAGTQNGAILGLRGDLDALHNCYAYAPNLVKENLVSLTNIRDLSNA
jgi:hypothetical protein